MIVVEYGVYTGLDYFSPSNQLKLARAAAAKVEPGRVSQTFEHWARTPHEITFVSRLASLHKRQTKAFTRENREAVKAYIQSLDLDPRVRRMGNFDKLEGIAVHDIVIKEGLEKALSELPEYQGELMAIGFRRWRKTRSSGDAEFVLKLSNKMLDHPAYGSTAQFYFLELTLLADSPMQAYACCQKFDDGDGRQPCLFQVLDLSLRTVDLLGIATKGASGRLSRQQMDVIGKQIESYAEQCLKREGP